MSWLLCVVFGADFREKTIWRACSGGVLILALLILGAQPGNVYAQSTAKTPGPGHPSMQTFRVGSEVYVRSLAFDKAANTLWVGTSLGAMEINLENEEVKALYTREHGLANEYIFALGIRSEGEVWFGTNAGGVSVLKGKEWKTYFPMHGLADYWVYAFAYDKLGKVWIGTWNGANYFDPATEKFITYRDELINIWVYGIDIDDRGRVWFATEGGVSMFDGTNWRSWAHKDGVGAANLANLPASGNTGLGTQSRHDLKVDVKNSESYNPDYVFAAKVDNSGRGIWFGTWGGGASIFDGENNWRSFTTADGLAGNIVYSIAQQSDGTLWFGTNHGVSSYDGKSWQSYNTGLAGSHVYAIAVDSSDRVWLGTKGGVTKMDFKQ